MNNKAPINTKAASLQFHLGNAWNLKGEIAKAIAHYQQVIELDPTYVAAYILLGEKLLRLGQKEEAIAIYRQAITCNPKEFIFQQRLADILVQEQEFIESNKFTTFLPQRDSKKGRILLYTDCPGIYGASQCNQLMMRQLVADGYALICVQGAANHFLIEEREKLGIQQLWLEPDNIYNLSKIPRAFSNYSEAEHILAIAQPDLIIFADGCPVSSLAAEEVAIGQKIPYIIIVHCVIPEWANTYATYLDRLPSVYHQARAVIAVSQENLSLLRQLFKLPEDRGQVIYNGRPSVYFTTSSPTDRNRLRQELGIPRDAVLCITTGRLDLFKGHYYQLDAIKQLKQSSIWSQLYFVWVGSGSLELILRSQVAFLGVTERVKFLGERSDIPALLDAADIFILPSQYEGMPLSVIEAMAKGLPVISTAVSGIPEALGDTGKLLPNPNLDSQATVRELVTTIQSWAVNPDLRRVIGLACQERAKKMFTEEKMIQGYREVIERVLVQNRERL